MPVNMPPTTSSYGKQVIVVLSTPPVNPKQPTLAEINAGLFLACHIYGQMAVMPEQSTGQGPRKGCTIVVPTELGSVTYPSMVVQYSYIPQKMGTAASLGNEAVEALTQGSNKHIYIADGIDGKTSALVANDVVTHIYVELGVQRRGYTGDGEFDKNAVTQAMVLKDGAEPDYNIKLAA